MVALPFRANRFMVSLIGTLCLLPLYLFWGGFFIFTFNAVDSPWVWGFGIVACWSQVLASLVSFLNPRKAALWLLVNTALSMLLAAGFVLRQPGGVSHYSYPVGVWPCTVAGLLKAASIFWAPPLVFASLLLRRRRSQRLAPVRLGAKQMTTSANR